MSISPRIKKSAIPWYDQAIDKLEQAVKQGEKSVDALRFLSNAYQGRAVGSAGNLAQAVADWDRAVALCQGDDRDNLLAKRRLARFAYAGSLARKDFQRAAAEIAKMLPEKLSASEKFAGARVLAFAAAAAENAKSPLADDLAGKSMALVRQARDERLFEKQYNIGFLEDLVKESPPLARRTDFQELLRQVRKK